MDYDDYDFEVEPDRVCDCGEDQVPTCYGTCDVCQLPIRDYPEDY